MINDPSYDMVILDELNIVLKYQYLDLEEVLRVFAAAARCCTSSSPAAMRRRPDRTGRPGQRDAPLKHPYKEQGVKAQKGVEF
jgi:cob(I)alamin adenosyltransferase